MRFCLPVLTGSSRVAELWLRAPLLLIIGVMLSCLPARAKAQDNAAPLSGPREMLRVMQIDDSLLGQFEDDQVVEGNEEEPLLRLLFRMPSFSQVDLDAWTRPIQDHWKLFENVADHRFEFFEVKGKVRRISQLKVLPELVRRIGFRNYFRLELDDAGNQSTVYCRKLPHAWRDADLSELVGQPVRVQGLLLKRFSHSTADTDPLDATDSNTGRTEREEIIFVAAHIGWYPSFDSASIEEADKQSFAVTAVTNDQALLGQMDVDVGRLTEIAHRAGMQGVDRESFYQLLAAVRNSVPNQLTELSRPDFDIAQMIQRPAEVTGELHRISGLARRAQLIRVNDSDIQKRFGLDHYWEIEVFVEMDKPVRFVDQATQQTRVFQDYPFVLCVAKVPENMETGEDIRVPVEFSGFFFKLWAYRTEFMSGLTTDESNSAKQLSPLLIGPTVSVPVRDTANESYLSLIIACFFVAALLIIWMLLWRAAVSDRKYAAKLFEKNEPTDDSFSFE